MNFELLSIPQLENIARTSRDEKTRTAAEQELRSRAGGISTAGTLPLFGKIGNRKSEIGNV